MHFGPISGLLSLLMVVAVGQVPPVMTGVERIITPNATFDIEHLQGKPREAPRLPYCWDEKQEYYVYTDRKSVV